MADDLRLIVQQRWSPRAPLLVLDELQKMPNWKTWLKGVYDGKPAAQQLLVTGSARLNTFRQSGESPASRLFGLRLHPFSVREWCAQTGATPEAALTHLLERGGFPEPSLIECNMRDDKPHRTLRRFADQFPDTQAVQVIRDLRHSFDIGRLQMCRADEWLNALLV